MGTCGVGTLLLFYLLGPGVGKELEDREGSVAKGNRPPGGPAVGSGSGQPCGGGRAGLLPGEGWPHAALAGQLQEGEARVILSAWV